MKVAIAGATGFVGSRLVEKLQEQGDSVVVLTRNVSKASKVFPASAFPQVTVVDYRGEQGWQETIAGCDGVVNLAGEPIADQRWSTDQKKKILESRQLGTRRLVEAIAQAKPKPKVLINASAIGYYGSSETATFDENSSPGEDFLAQVCQAWETEAEKVKQAKVRLVIIRIGIVLGNGGALGKMLTPFQIFAGGPLGSGKQWFSWIHRDDLVSLILESLKRRNVKGILNGTAPNPVRMGQLCQTLGEVMNRPSWLPVPDFALELLLGDGAQVVLEGQQVLPKKTQGTGFKYQYPTLKPALKEIVQNL